MDGVLLPGLKFEEVIEGTGPARHWMDGVVEGVEASDKPDFIQGTLTEGLVFRPCLLLDEGRRNQADRDIMFGGVLHNALVLELITFGLHEVLTFSVKLGCPDLVWGGPIFIFEPKSGIVRVVRILKPPTHIIIKGRQVLSVKQVKTAELFRGKNRFIYLHLGENRIRSRLWSSGEGKKINRARDGVGDRLLLHGHQPEMCVLAMVQGGVRVVYIQGRAKSHVTDLRWPKGG